MLTILLIVSLFIAPSYSLEDQVKSNTKTIKKEDVKRMEEARRKMLMVLQQKMKNLDINKLYDNYKKQPIQNPKIDVIRDRVYGKKDAKYKMIVFSDFACGHCSKASSDLRSRVDENKDTVNLNYAFFPLDKKCNKNVAGRLSDYSCPSFILALCAEKEGKLKEAIPYLYKMKPDVQKKEAFDPQKLIASMAKDLKLKDLKNCVGSEWAKKRILEENEIYKGMKIRGTPIVLLNGKELGPVYKSKVLFKEFIKKIESEENPKGK